ncbi:MAG: 6-phosphofructokinase [Negativicutes bacterium]|nr:6-phosphofructokinase [Negativicutes bacterium]
MSRMKGNALIAQSGGPTAVINASVCGVVQEALKYSEINHIYGAQNGILGLIKGRLFDLRREKPETISRLKNTPGAALGSVRYKLKTEEDYENVINALKKHDIRYFFYAGGNDSMDTADKVNKLAARMGYDLCCMGVPKTVDNDLPFTDHCPGFGSAAKYLATTVAEAWIDQRDLPSTKIMIVETMGRHAGWMAGSTALAKRYDDDGPHLIYLPEVPFDIDQFVNDVRDIYNAIDRVMIVVSEGIHLADGTLVDQAATAVRDAFGHAALGGGASRVLKELLDREIGAKSRFMVKATAQRAAAHWASQTDIDEAWMVGAKAVEFAMQGHSGMMVTIEREPGPVYKSRAGMVELARVANVEHMVPREWINERGNYVEQPFIDYCAPLIEGQPQFEYHRGLPVYARLEKHFIVPE